MLRPGRATTGTTTEVFLLLSSSSFFLSRSVPDSARDLATTTCSTTLAEGAGVGAAKSSVTTGIGSERGASSSPRLMRSSASSEPLAATTFLGLPTATRSSERTSFFCIVVKNVLGLRTTIAAEGRGGEEGRGIEAAVEVEEGAMVEEEEEEENRVVVEEERVLVEVERDLVGRMGETRPSSKVRVGSVRTTPVGGVCPRLQQRGISTLGSQGEGKADAHLPSRHLFATPVPKEHPNIPTPLALRPAPAPVRLSPTLDKSHRLLVLSPIFDQADHPRSRRRFSVLAVRSRRASEEGAFVLRFARRTCGELTRRREERGGTADGGLVKPAQEIAHVPDRVVRGLLLDLGEREREGDVGVAGGVEKGGLLVE